MSEYDKNYSIPRYLDEPMRVILWTIDELLALLLSLATLYWLSNQLLLGLFVGLLAMFALKKVKGDRGQSFFKSLVYWYFPPIVRFHQTPPSSIRHYIG